MGVSLVMTRGCITRLFMACSMGPIVNRASLDLVLPQPAFARSDSLVPGWRSVVDFLCYTPTTCACCANQRRYGRIVFSSIKVLLLRLISLAPSNQTPMTRLPDATAPTLVIKKSNVFCLWSLNIRVASGNTRLWEDSESWISSCGKICNNSTYQTLDLAASVDSNTCRTCIRNCKNVRRAKML